MILVYLTALALLAAAAFFYARSRAMALPRPIHSLPAYHGWRVALFVAVPMALVLILWSPIAPRLLIEHALNSLPVALQPIGDLQRAVRVREILGAALGQSPDGVAAETVAVGAAYAANTQLAGFLMLALGVLVGAAGFAYAIRSIQPEFRARHTVERFVKIVLIGCSVLAVLTTVGIVASVFFETLRFFSKVSPFDFLFGLQWSPQTALRADQVGSSGAFGIIPLFTGTILIMLVAMAVAVPIGLFAAIYMAEYASPRMRTMTKPILEILAGIPTVVYGFFAALTVAPLVRDIGRAAGFDVSSESALAAGMVMGIMIMPFISSLADDVINAVPQSLRDGSYAMGATKSETIKRVVLPAALPGIVSAIMLAISKAIGETMIVVMAAGFAANLSFNPLDSVTTITVQIATLLVGDQEFDSAKTLSAFALGFVLFIFTLILNVIALQIVKKYREQYD